MSLSTKSQASKTIPGVLLVSKAAKPKSDFSCMQLIWMVVKEEWKKVLIDTDSNLEQHQHLEPEEPLAKTQVTPHFNCHHPHPEQRTLQNPGKQVEPFSQDNIS